MHEPGAWLFAFVVAAFAGLVLGLYTVCAPEPPCQDYSYKLSRVPLNRKVATCRTDQTMRIERLGFLGGQMVHCSCKEVTE